MDIYLLAFNIIVADKLLGGAPSKIIEHIVINNVFALSWWGATKILYGAGYLAMLPFTTNTSEKQSSEEYSLVDAAFYNEYVIQQRSIPIPPSLKLSYTPKGCNNETFEVALGCKRILDPTVCDIADHLTNNDKSEQVPTLNNLSEWEIVNKDESKIILTNNKTAKQIIISKREVDDMVVINKE